MYEEVRDKIKAMQILINQTFKADTVNRLQKRISATKYWINIYTYKMIDGRLITC